MNEPGLEAWRQESIAALEAMPEVTLLPRTTVFGYYDQGVLGAVERVADHLPQPPAHTARQRYWTIRAKEVVLATGAHERIIAFPGNDFWLFDDRLVRVNHFTGDGAMVDQEVLDEPALAKLCGSAFEAVWERAVPHEEYQV